MFPVFLLHIRLFQQQDEGVFSQRVFITQDRDWELGSLMINARMQLLAWNHLEKGRFMVTKVPQRYSAPPSSFLELHWWSYWDTLTCLVPLKNCSCGQRPQSDSLLEPLWDYRTKNTAGCPDTCCCCCWHRLASFYSLIWFKTAWCFNFDVKFDQSYQNPFYPFRQVSRNLT